MNPLIAALLAAGVISAEEARTLNGLLNEGATRIEAEQRVAAAFATGFENQRSRLIRALDAGNVDYRDPMLPTFWAAEHDLLARDVLPTLTGIAQDVALTATVRSGGLADWRTVNESVIAWTDSHYRSVAGDALGSIPNLDNTARDAVADAVNRWQRGELNAGPGPMGLPRLIAELQNVEAFGVDRAARIAVTETTRIFAESERTAALANPNMVYLVWQTGNDEFVCPICGPMEGQRIPKGQNTFPGGYYPPAHVNCRCSATGVSELAAEVMSGAAGKGSPARAGASPAWVATAAPDLSTAQGVRTRYAQIQAEADALIERSSIPELQRQYDAKTLESATAFSNIGPSDNDWKQLMRLYGERDALNKQINEAKRTDPLYLEAMNKIKEARRLVHVNDPVSWTGKYPNAKATPQLENGFNEFNRLVSSRVVDSNLQVNVRWGARRASAVFADTAINVTKDEVAHTVVHELGHILEFKSPEIADKAQAFLDRRTVGEKSTWMGQGYRRDEKSKPDKFISPYIGKVYNYPGYKATEVISMGVQYMYESPVKFAREDPDMFDFIYNLLRGL